MTLVRLDQSRGVDLVKSWSERGYRHGAEIGTFAGVFAAQICQGLKGVRLICVDPWMVYDGYNQDPKNTPEKMEKSYQSARRRLAPYRVDIRRKTSHDAAATVPDASLDFVYIDGNHAEPFISEDLTLWTPKVRRGGMVCGHDYVRKPGRLDLQVADAVDRFLATSDVTVTLYMQDKFPSFAWEVA